MELSKNEEIQERLYQEVKNVSLEDKSLDTINSLPYLDKCVKEAQRLHAIIPALNRTALVDTEIMGFAVPAGTQISASVRGIHTKF